MTLLALNLLSLVCYLASQGCYAGFLVKRTPKIGLAGRAFLLLGLAVHFASLLERASVIKGVPYRDLYGSMSLYAWYLGVIYLGLELYHKQKSMSVFLLPIVIVLQAIAALVHKKPIPLSPSAKGWMFALHVNVTMLAYSAFAVSFIVSTMYLIQHWRLRNHRPGRWLGVLPSLTLLERVNVTSVIIGVSGLFIGIITGALWAQQAWSKEPGQWDAKITWSLIVLVIYSLYVVLQKRRGWRGQRSAWLAVGGFVVVLFSYTLVNLFFSRLHTFF